jgi:O-antigen/teichoic acid export membrane protein
VGVAASYFGVVAWLGAGFSLAGDVAVFAMVGNMVNLCTGMLTQYVAAIGKPILELRYVIVSVVINITLTIPMALLGPLGVAAASTIGTTVASFYLLCIVRRGYRADVPGFVRDVPVMACTFAFITTVVLEFVITPLGMRGPAGLLICAAPAVFGLVVFALLTVRKDLRSFYAAWRLDALTLKVIVDALVRR